MNHKTYKPEDVQVGDKINTKKGKLVIGEILYYQDFNSEEIESNVWNNNKFQFNGTIYGKNKKDNFFYSIEIDEDKNLNKKMYMDLIMGMCFTWNEG